MTFDAGDPKWAAYVLSELDPADAALVEQELRSSPEARDAVASLRETAVLLRLALDTLPSLELSADQRQTIEDASRDAKREHVQRDSAEATASSERPTWRRLAFAGMTAGALGVAAVALLVAQWLLGDRVWARPVQSAGLVTPVTTAAQGPSEMRFEITTPPTDTPASLAISPDGRAIVYAALPQAFTSAPTTSTPGSSELWVRAMDSVSPRLLTNGNLISFPFWAPDGRSVGYFADGKLKRIGIDGGAPLVIADAPSPRGGAWGPDGTILFAPDASGPIHRVPSAGGNPSVVTHLTSHQTSHGFPQFLPDGTRFLFLAQGDPKERGIHAGRLTSLDATRIVDADAAAWHPQSGQLLFVRQGTLLSQGFDPIALALTGAPSAIGEGVVAERTGAVALSASAAGAIVFRATAASSGLQLGDAGALSISPDGRWIAYQVNESGRSDIWVRSFKEDGQPQSPGVGGARPVWRADGSELFFVDRNGQTMSVRVARKPDGTTELGTPARLLTPVWSRDGRSLIFTPRPIVVLLNWRPRT
jgi:anti-sigma factor RsiW